MKGRYGVAVLLTFAAASVSLTGCSAARTGCSPQPLHLSSSTPAQGAVLTVSSKAAGCSLKMTEDGVYQISLVSDARPSVRTRPISVDVDPSGRFSTAIDVPADFPTGAAHVHVVGVTIPCAADESCPGYIAQLRVQLDDESQPGRMNPDS
jgi:hypothetical protein